MIPIWAITALGGAAIVAAGVVWHFDQVADARAEGWATATAAALEAKVEEDRLRRQANQGVTDRATQQRIHLAAAAAAARTERDELLAELARRGAPGDPAAGDGADDAATAARALGECSGRYQDVARAADALTAQVRGLQDYARSVCMTPAPVSLATERTAP